MNELLKRLNAILLALRNWSLDLIVWLVSALINLLKALLEWLRKPAVKIEFWSDGQLIGGTGMANETQLHNNKKKHIELVFKDDAGVVRPVDGLPDIKGPLPEGVCNIQLDDDHMGFQLFGLNPNSESPGIVGDVVVTVTADVDKTPNDPSGGGFKPLTEELTVHVVEPEAPQASDIEFKTGDEQDL